MWLVMDGYHLAPFQLAHPPLPFHAGIGPVTRHRQHQQAPRQLRTRPRAEHSDRVVIKDWASSTATTVGSTCETAERICPEASAYSRA